MQAGENEAETFNPWSVVNLVFGHLAEEGLHPVLGEHGDPSAAARALLLALGIEPSPEGNWHIKAEVHTDLERIRAVMLDERE